MLPVLPPLRQLALPLQPLAPRRHLVLRGPHLLPQRVWRGLHLGLQAQVRHTVLRVCLELARDDPNRS
jgi:hypothetical protein